MKNKYAPVEKIALSRAEAAAALGISLPSLHRLIKRGLLHPSRSLRRPLFLRRELERFLEETSRTIGV